MIGRAAQGRPWIFREIAHYLDDRQRTCRRRRVAEIRAVLRRASATTSTRFYGEERGVRIARKHIGWYTKGLPVGRCFRARMNTLETAASSSPPWRASSTSCSRTRRALEYDDEVALAA